MKETELKPCKCGMSIPFAYSTNLLLCFTLWHTIICVGCRKTKVRARTLEKAIEKWNRRADREQNENAT